MSSELDWSDPKKLMRRDGGEVLACGFHDRGAYRQNWAATLSPHGRIDARLYNSDGSVSTARESDCDIIPRPREPKAMDGFVCPIAFEKAYEFGGCVTVQTEQTSIRKMRVRITEVIDE